MVNTNQESTDFSRRKFLKGGAILGASAGLAAVSGGKVTEDVVQAFGTKELDEFPIELSPDFKRYDEKNTMFSRGAWDTEVIERGRFQDLRNLGTKPGYYQNDLALKMGAWSVSFAFGYGYGQPAYEWEGPPVAEKKFEYKSNVEASKAVKKAAKFYGADLVGICKYEDVEKWVYDSMYNEMNREVYTDKDFPFKPKSVIVLAFEMDYELYKTAPSYLASAATGQGYSKMATLSYQVANFLRGLGYKSFAIGNNVAESVPLAIQAGLGELGRHGLLLTKEYGPRVRLCKVFTEMELTPDKPIEFGGMKFCEVCKRCAEACPSESIPYDTERSFTTITNSNHSGMKKWYVNVESCYDFWIESDSDCGCCISACPYNKPNFWHHTITSGMTSTPIRPFLKYMDELFGYGKTFDEQVALDFWEKD